MNKREKLDHIDYEYLMAVRLYQILLDDEFCNYEPAIKNAISESFIIHVRSLAEFHGTKKEKGRPRDILRNEIILSDEYEGDERLRKLIAAAHQGVAHLTQNRNSIKEWKYDFSAGLALLDHHFQWRKSADPSSAPTIKAPNIQLAATTTTSFLEVEITEHALQKPAAEEE